MIASTWFYLQATSDEYQETRDQKSETRKTMMKRKFSLRDRLNSFGFAIAGLKTLFSEEHNAYLHLVGMVVAVGLGFYFSVSKMEWIALVMCIGLVFAMEILNSSIEAIADHVTPEYHDNIKKIKDLAAASVLVVAAMSVVVGLIIFWPKLSY